MKKQFFKVLFGLFMIAGIGSGLQVFATSAVIDPAFDTGLPYGFDFVPYPLITQSDGKILVGGAFTTYKGVTSNRIIRLNTDGTRDTAFNIGSGFNGSLNGLAIQSDGKIITAGSFTNYSGTTVNRIIRLNTDGTRDTAFNIGSGFNGAVYSLVIQNDGKIIAAGDFTNYSGTTVNRIIRLNTDGTRDTAFNIGSGLDSIVSDLAIQSDGKIIAAGNITSYSGTTINRIVRINSNGTRDTSFNISTAMNQRIMDIAVQNDGGIIVVGDFTVYGGVTTNCIVRLDSNGNRDNSFNIGAGFNNRLQSITLQRDGKIIIGGAFTSYNGISANRIIRLNTDGTTDASFNQDNKKAFDGSILSSMIQSDGKIIAGGAFSNYNGITINRLVRINQNGSRDNSFNIGSGFNGNIYTLAGQSDGKIIAAGNFTNYNGTTTNRIIRLNIDGTRDDAFNIGAGINDTVYKLAIQNDGKIIAGGPFTYYNGVAVSRFFRMNSDGSIDYDFGTGNVNSEVDAIAIQSDGKIIVGGYFTSYRFTGSAVNRIIRLNSDGTKDSSFNIGAGFNDAVQTLAIQSDGKIIVGGKFTSYSGTTANRIIRLNTDGTRDISFSIGSGFNNNVQTLAIQNDGKIIIGGKFTNYNGTTTNRIICLNIDGSIDSEFVIGSGFNNTVQTLAIQNSGTILIGGDFTNYNGIASFYLTLLAGNIPLVKIPDSQESSIVNNSFTTEGYSEINGALVGSTPISLTMVNGKIPVDLNLSNQNINLFLPTNTTFETTLGGTYSGIFYIATLRNGYTLNDKNLITAFNIGTPSEKITLSGGAAILSIPTSGTVGDSVNIYYSDDNDISRYPVTTTQIIDKNGVPTIEFSTTSLGNFIITNSVINVTISYNITGATNQNVITTITGVSDLLTGLNAASYTFTDNGTFTFTFQDMLGNTGLAIASVNWIDKTVPTASVVYSTTGNTTQDVVATITGFSEEVTALNTSSYTFTGNDSFTFTFQDIAGNTGEAIATVNRINKETNSGNNISNGGGGSTRHSSSYSSNIVDTTIITDPIENNILIHNAANDEYTDVYLWAYKNGITTMPTIEKANLKGKIYRSHLAKIISTYATKILNKKPDIKKDCSFTDLYGQSKEMKIYITAACELGLMGLNSDGIPSKKFNPTERVSRAQFGTILSRLLYGNMYNTDKEDKRYTNHLQALQKHKIMNNISNPFMDESRGNVFLMLMKSVK